MRRGPTQDTGAAVRLDARVRSDAGRGSEANGDDNVSFSSNNAVLRIDDLATESREVPAVASARVSYQKRIENTGLFTGSLALDDDALPADNQFYFSFAVERRPSVLSIDGGSRSSYRESFFLGKAFDIGADRRYDYESGNAALLNRRGMADKTLVFVGNLSALSSAAISDIRSYAENGGVLVLSFGDRANVSAYTTALRELGIGTVDRIVSPGATQGTDAIIGEVSWRHPIFSDLQGVAGGILRPKFRRYARVDADSSAAIVASFDSGDPWIIEKLIGQGSVIVTTATLGSEWTNLPINELYVPFIYQIARYAIGISQDRMMYTVGEAVSLSGSIGDEWNIRNPRGDVFKVELSATNLQGSSRSSRGFFRETDLPGQYTATNGANRFVFSVNVDPEESVLRARDSEQVYASVVTPASELPATIASPAELIESEEGSQKLWRILLAMVLALFIAESFLANKPTLGRTAIK
jgi:hypothetical protein